jgi:hypothetical protein
MAINTRDKRASVLGLDFESWGLEQNPSGTIAQSGQQMTARVYSGILATAPAFLFRRMLYRRTGSRGKYDGL